MVPSKPRFSVINHTPRTVIVNSKHPLDTITALDHTLRTVISVYQKYPLSLINGHVPWNSQTVPRPPPSFLLCKL